MQLCGWAGTVNRNFYTWSIAVSLSLDLRYVFNTACLIPITFAITIHSWYLCNLCYDNCAMTIVQWHLYNDICAIALKLWMIPYTIHGCSLPACQNAPHHVIVMEPYPPIAKQSFQWFSVSVGSPHSSNMDTANPTLSCDHQSSLSLVQPV